MSLTRHYHALAPVLARIPPAAFPDPAHLSKSQDALIKSTLDLEHPNAHSPTAQTWRRLFWRRMIRIIEQGFTAREAQGEDIQDEEVHPRILEAMLSYLVEPPRTIQEQREPNLHLTRRYFWGPPEQEQDTSNCVETVEDGRMISGGTTGLRTWQAAIALSNHILSTPSLVLSAETGILELGAGIGLLSLVVARVACQQGVHRSVTATDLDVTLGLLRENVQLNYARVAVEELDWEMAATAEGIAQLVSREANSRPMLILGADIVYDPTLAITLAGMLKFLLRPYAVPLGRQRGPSALIAATVRNAETWAGFLAACQTNELAVQEEPLNLLGVDGRDGIVGTEGWEGEGKVVLVRITAK